MKQFTALSPDRQVRDAFTLIELLVVITIIAILSAILLSTAGYIQDKASVARAQSEIKAIETALDAFKQDDGDFPIAGSKNGAATGDGNTGDGSEKSTKGLIQLLCPDPSDGKVYFQIPIKMLQAYKPSTGQDYKTTKNSSTSLVDPFGNPYYYYYKSGGPATNPVTSSQNNGPQFPDLWSYGKNPDRNKSNPKTWITNWSNQ